jgi:uncharacterized protein (TIGR02001 family)
MYKKYAITVCAFALIGNVVSVHAQSTENSPKPTDAVTGNVALTSDYVFRGLTQTWAGSAVQGGTDLALPNGFAAGVWASSISSKSYPGAALELDLYANYGMAINADWSWRVGLYSYLYPKGNLSDAGLQSRSFNTTEANATLSWKWLSVKYSRALTDYFGIDKEQGYRDNSKGSGYAEINAAIPFNAQWSLALHAAHTNITTHLSVALADGTVNPSYTDFGATVKHQFVPHWSVSVAATHANNKAFYSSTASFCDAFDTRNTGGTRGFVMLQGTF